MSTNGGLSFGLLEELPNFSPYPNEHASLASGSNLIARTAYASALVIQALFQQKFNRPLYFAEANRPYVVQVQYFTDRYMRGSGTVWWNGSYWRLRPNCSVAAVPGTSNHGWALSVDWRSNVGTRGSAEYLWMQEVATKYGWRNDVASEAWHWTYYGGGVLERAGGDYEEITMALTSDEKALLKMAADSYAQSVAAKESAREAVLQATAAKDETRKNALQTAEAIKQATAAKDETRELQKQVSELPQAIWGFRSNNGQTFSDMIKATAAASTPGKK